MENIIRRYVDFSVFSTVFHRLGVCLRTDILMATVAINILSLALPIVILQCYDRIIPNNGDKTLTLLIIGLCVCIFLDTVLRLARVSVMNRLGAQFEHNALLNSMQVILGSNIGEFEKRRHTDYLEKLRAIDNIREIQFGQNILSLIDLPFILLFIGLIWYFTGWLVLVPIALFIAFSIYSVSLSKTLYNALIQKDKITEVRHNFLLELLQGIQTLKPLAMENQMMRRYERLQGRSANAMYDLANVNNVIQSSTSTMSQITMVVFVAVGAIPAASGSITMGALAAGSLLSGRILQPASRAMSFFMQWQTTKLYEDKVVQLLETKQEVMSEENKNISLSGKIQLQNISFKYPKSESPVLHDLNLEVNENNFISIIGENGSGKTTLARIIVGLQDATGGELIFDDAPVSHINKNSLRRQIAYIPQRGVLFNGTILENLTAFRGGTHVQEAISAAEDIGLNNSVMRLVDGLSTKLDSTLVDNLPEGLRQRITMVRSLSGGANILVFDDANTGYDPENSKKLTDYFRSIKGKKTIITFTHSESIIGLSDKCYKLTDGKLVQLFSRLDGKTNQHKKLKLSTDKHPTITGGDFHE
ncbi:Alpha-hemolysin translocation ATP-binding protein HlyB [Thalassocella blandensis]|nr:Alpha-hemolysin translocation ATP-binding protein HlyB [Thalassocella blandensis]